MKIYDVTMPISEDMQVYKNYVHKRPIFSDDSSIKRGDSVNEKRLSINLHTGTHMDFPLHMLEHGANSDSLVLERLITTVHVYDLTHVKDKIEEKDLMNLKIEEGSSVIFKTTNSLSETWIDDFVAVGESAARYLASKHLNLVGIDGLGIERGQKGHPTHKTLMAEDIYIIEGLRLSEIKEGEYMMYALPIKTKGSDALLLSVVLIEG